MASFNQITIIGNLSRDPELRALPKGTAVAQFGICANREFKDESGQKRTEAMFIDVEAWGKQAELVSKYLVKGSLALIQGRLKLESWDDKQTGSKHSRHKIVLETVQFLGRPANASGERRDSQSAQSRGDTKGGAGAGAREERSQPSERPPADPIDDDIPF